MGFWSGFEGLTGHRPGAFKGFSLKDVLDEDMWKMVDRKFPSPRYAEEGLPAPQTAWYKGMGRPEMMGPEVGAAGVPVKESQIPSVRHDAPTYQERFDATTLANQQRRNALWGSGPATVSAARPWANIQSQMLSDPGQGDIASQAEQNRLRAINSGNPDALRAAGITPAMGDIQREPAMADKTIVKKTFADPNQSDTVTETIKMKEPIGPAYNRHPPNFMMRTGVMGEDYFGRPPTSIMNMLNMQSWQDVARRKWEERMRARRGYYYVRNNSWCRYTYGFMGIA